MTAKQALVHAILSEMASQGITQKNLAQRLGCTQVNIAQILNDGRAGMRLDTAERLASALGRRLFLVLLPEASLATIEDVEPRARFTERARMSAKQALVHAIEKKMASQEIGRKVLARRLGCTEEAVAQMLDGRKSGMLLNTAEKLASALGQRLFLGLIPDTWLADAPADSLPAVVPFALSFPSGTQDCSEELGAALGGIVRRIQR